MAVVVVLAAPLATVVVGASRTAAAGNQDWPMFLHDCARSAAIIDGELSVARPLP